MPKFHKILGLIILFKDVSGQCFSIFRNFRTCTTPILLRRSQYYTVWHHGLGVLSRTSRSSFDYWTHRTRRDRTLKELSINTKMLHVMILNCTSTFKNLARKYRKLLKGTLLWNLWFFPNLIPVVRWILLTFSLRQTENTNLSWCTKIISTKFVIPKSLTSERAKEVA